MGDSSVQLKTGPSQADSVFIYNQKALIRDYTGGLEFRRQGFVIHENTMQVFNGEENVLKTFFVENHAAFLWPYILILRNLFDELHLAFYLPFFAKNALKCRIERSFQPQSASKSCP